MTVFQIDVYEILIDLPETSSGYTRHGDEKSGSTVLFLLHSVGVDYELVTFQICNKKGNPLFDTRALFLFPPES